MTIESLEDGLFIQVPSAVEYTIDGTWKKLEANDSIEVHMGQFVSLKKTYVTGLNFGTFIINGRCNLRGNCMSMIFGDSGYKNNDLSGLYQPFHSMFKNCTGIVSVEPTFLPATTLASSCYENMFYGCTSLTTAPELPATTLADYCYRSMFYGCTGLTSAPDLPATTLASSCYENMFYGCTSLTTAPELPATTLASSCYENMFYGCTSLTTAPELPATTLASSCYNYMFNGCTKLNYIKMLATDISAGSCLYSWVNGVASSGTFVKNPAVNSLLIGTSGIPSGWTVVNDGEESGGKPTNCLTLKPSLNKGDINVDFSFDFPPTSDLTVNLSISNGPGNTTAQINFWKDVQSGSKNSIGMGTSTEIQILSYEPAEDDTYIYEIIIEQ
jgi:hypothetical protein